MMDAALLFPVEPLRQFFDAGGPVVVILLAASVVALAIVLVKLWHFRSLRITDLRFAEEALARYRAGRRQSAIDHAETSPNPASQALARVLRGLERGLPEDKVREEVVRYGNSTLQELRGGLRPLEVIGSLAPLLGLLGTVLGMIKAFQALELAGSRVDPAVLSGGIWEALLTTAVGLAVAIPVVALLNWLEVRIERVAYRMDDIVTRAFTVDLSGPQSSEPKTDHEPQLHSESARA